MPTFLSNQTAAGFLLLTLAAWAASIGAMLISSYLEEQRALRSERPYSR